MTYRGEVKRWRAPLGIKPTWDDHKYVQSLSLMRVGVREICAKVAERLGLEKPLSRMSLYYHFRDDLQKHKRGRHAAMRTEEKRRAENPASDIRGMIEQMKKRRV